MATIRSLIEELAAQCAALDVEHPDATPAQTLADITQISEQAGLLLGSKVTSSPPVFL